MTKSQSNRSPVLEKLKKTLQNQDGYKSGVLLKEFGSSGADKNAFRDLFNNSVDTLADAAPSEAINLFQAFSGSSQSLSNEDANTIVRKKFFDVVTNGPRKEDMWAWGNRTNLFRFIEEITQHSWADKLGALIQIEKIPDATRRSEAGLALIQQTHSYESCPEKEIILNKLIDFAQRQKDLEGRMNTYRQLLPHAYHADENNPNAAESPLKKMQDNFIGEFEKAKTARTLKQINQFIDIGEKKFFWLGDTVMDAFDARMNTLSAPASGAEKKSVAPSLNR